MLLRSTEVRIEALRGCKVTGYEEVRFEEERVFSARAFDLYLDLPRERWQRYVLSERLDSMRWLPVRDVPAIEERQRVVRELGVPQFAIHDGDLSLSLAPTPDPGVWSGSLGRGFPQILRAGAMRSAFVLGEEWLHLVLADFELLDRQRGPEGWSWTLVNTRFLGEAPGCGSSVLRLSTVEEDGEGLLGYTYTTLSAEDAERALAAGSVEPGITEGPILELRVDEQVEFRGALLPRSATYLAHTGARGRFWLHYEELVFPEGWFSVDRFPPGLEGHRAQVRAEPTDVIFELTAPSTPDSGPGPGMEPSGSTGVGGRRLPAKWPLSRILATTVLLGLALGLGCAARGRWKARRRSPI